MDLFKLKVIRILFNINTSLVKDMNVWKISDKDILIEYIFDHLNDQNVDTFYYYFKESFPNTYLDLLKSHFTTIIKVMDFPTSYILDCYEKFGFYFIEVHLEEIESLLDLFEYREVMMKLKDRENSLNKKLETLSPILYQFYDAIKLDDKASYFNYSIFLPLLQVHIDDYLKSIQKTLFLDKSLEVQYLDSGSSRVVFDVNEKIVKFSTISNFFPIYMHYRMNEFYVRKKLNLKTGYILLEICPKGDLAQVTEQDIKDALYDLKGAGLIVTDKHYAQNFAYFEEDADLCFQDVDGIIEYREKEFSQSYQKKKVKLIDHEYVYDQNDPNKCWINV